jgi:uncharacterized membrane protein (GlpM family)
MSELVIRFLVGGALVSGFALVGNVLKPKSFAGLFGAAPSVAVATLILTIAKDGRWMAACEARAMLAGAAALCIYCLLVIRILKKSCKMRVPAATVASITIWLTAAFGLWSVFLR